MSEKTDSDGEKPTSSDSKITAAVPNEDNTQLLLSLRVRGLKPKNKVSKFFARMSKPQNPEPLCGNAEFQKWNLTNDSLDVKMTVYGEGKKTPIEGQEAPEAKKGQKSEVFELKINRFPSSVVAEDTKFDVLQPPRRDYSFIMLRMKKKDTSGMLWQKYQSENGTLDADE